MIVQTIYVSGIGSVPRLPVRVLPIVAYPFPALCDDSVDLLVVPDLLSDIGEQFVRITPVIGRAERLEVPRVVRTASGTGDNMMDLERFIAGPALTVPKRRVVDLDTAALEVHPAILADVLVAPQDCRLDLGPKYPSYQIGRSIGIRQLLGAGDIELAQLGEIGPHLLQRLLGRGPCLTDHFGIRVRSMTVTAMRAWDHGLFYGLARTGGAKRTDQG